MKAATPYSYLALCGALARGLVERPWFPASMWKTFFKRAISIGARCAPTGFMMAFCAGFVIALVLKSQLAQMDGEDKVPEMVWNVMTDQLAPLLTAVLFIGRSVSGSAAELANMTIGEEIKALETMGVDLSRYLLLPVLAAFVSMLPVMEIYIVGIGLLGAFSVCSLVMGMGPDEFVARTLENAQVKDLLHGAEKAAIFAVVAAMIAFHKGLNVSGGSDAVGRVATASVVAALVAVTVVNAVVTALQYSLN